MDVGAGSWTPDGMCDYTCNVPECGYDFGDCCMDTCMDRYHDCDGSSGNSPTPLHCIDPEAADRFGGSVSNSNNHTDNHGNTNQFMYSGAQNGTIASCPKLIQDTPNSSWSNTQTHCIYHCQCGEGQYCDGYTDDTSSNGLYCEMVQLLFL